MKTLCFIIYFAAYYLLISLAYSSRGLTFDDFIINGVINQIGTKVWAKIVSVVAYYNNYYAVFSDDYFFVRVELVDIFCVSFGQFVFQNC